MNLQETVMQPSNLGKVYKCRLKDTTVYLDMQLCCDNYGVIHFSYKRNQTSDPTKYYLEDVVEVKSEVIVDVFSPYYTRKGKTEDDIEHLLIQEDVYKFSDKQELLLIYEALNFPDTNINVYDQDQHIFGVVHSYFVWEYGDCENHLEIIVGVK